MAQQQHQQQQPPPPQGSVASAPPTMPAAPAQAPQAQAPHAAVSLQQLIMAAQQQRPGSTPLPQLDANTARLVTDALNMAKQQAQQQHQAGAPPAAAPVAPPPQPYQQNMATYGSVDSTSPPAVVPPQPQQHHQHQQTLLASAQLLGSLNPKFTRYLTSVSISESHAKELQDGGYQLPQAVAILLADARRKEEKRQAKRIANRKSACTSRARKKAQIDQLMNENAQLRRMELILSYLPDPVIVISPQGVITFCSMQLERVFKHKVNDLVGANIEDLMIPKSRGVIKKLIRDMLAAEQELSDPSENGDDAKKSAGGDISGGSGGHPFGNSEHASESAFPLLEVKVNSTQVDAGEDVSDSDENRRHSPNGKKSSQAAATEISSLTHKDSSFNSNEGDDATPPLKKAKVDTNGKKTNSSESDESSDQRNANANLSKNVEACKLNKDKNVEVRFSHKDDVMGAYVTANNADAKLSSLMHEPLLKTKHVMGPADKQEEQCSSTMDSSLSKTSSEKAQAKKGNSSEDSGYREGGESPEDSNSSSSCASIEIASLTRKRARPMAPSRNVCLIRSDLSTIWCEMTSSVRTSIPQDDADRGSVSKEGSVQEPEEMQKEILLCFRPIQEGEKVSSDLRFRRVISQEKQSDGSGSGSNPKIPGVSESSGGGSGSNTAYTSNGADPSSTETPTDVDGSMQLKKNRPLKKRAFDMQESVQVGNKKSRPAETSAVESMMELAKKPSFP
ncbi:hypothetical protein QTG54_002769 [Skeletonema marinoi]|uniref:PAS domain-containing protein n=1 Tax=Skeletonema marinoi TaxID=267567 RepID=A0AAD8YHF5_9STRA|nr:hypothetical protein QTG54_002769 [Skeletonema marinoi]